MKLLFRRFCTLRTPIQLLIGSTIFLSLLISFFHLDIDNKLKEFISSKNNIKILVEIPPNINFIEGSIALSIDGKIQDTQPILKENGFNFIYLPKNVCVNGFLTKQVDFYFKGIYHLNNLDNTEFTWEENKTLINCEKVFLENLSPYQFL